MKKISLLAATAILFTAAAETIQLEILNNNGFEKTTAKGAIRDWTYNPYSKRFNGGGSFTSVPNGYKGKAAKLKCSEGQRIYLYNSKPIQVKEGKDTLIVSFWCKGKGNLQILLYGYNAANKNIGGWNGAKMMIDAKEWKKYTWTIPLKTTGKDITQIRIAPTIVGETDLEIDEAEFSIERKID